MEFPKAYNLTHLRPNSVCHSRFYLLEELRGETHFIDRTVLRVSEPRGVVENLVVFRIQARPVHLSSYSCLAPLFEVQA